MCLNNEEENMEFHPVAEIFPLMTDEEMFALRADIRANGLREPIWTYEGKIIDGRNRYVACGIEDIEPEFREWDGKGSLVTFIVSMNLHRRHLTPSQKAMIGAGIEKKLGEEAKRKETQRKRTFQKIEKSPPIHAAKQAAAIVGTNPQYVIDAKRIAEEAPEMVEKVVKGEINIQDAKRYMSLDKERRKKVLNTGLLFKTVVREAVEEAERKTHPFLQRRHLDALRERIFDLYHALVKVTPDDLDELAAGEGDKKEMQERIGAIQDRLGVMADVLRKKRGRKKN
jgi:hypothetical protein